MAALSADVVDRFANLCHLAHRSWATWRALRAGVHRDDDYSRGMPRSAATALGLVMLACQEHAILQIAKLHDPAAMQGKVTLGLDFIAKYGGWDPATSMKLDTLKMDLDALSKSLRENLRNKRIAHNDLGAVMAEGAIVIFEAGQDEEYFTKLWGFLDIVYGEVKGGAFLRSDTPRHDAEDLAKWLSADRVVGP